jgi:acrylyl-CoA reductase (NADPH)
MPDDTFKGLVVDERDGSVNASVQMLDRGGLPEGDVLVRVVYSSLNYKDGLALTGRNKVVRSYPMVPGVDLVGTVEESRAPGFKPGDRVVMTGSGPGETRWGGYAQLARVNAEWLVPLPSTIDFRQAMGIGTAGFAAMMCVMGLEEHGLKPGGRPVVVSGAAGGVGSTAIAILARLGYHAVASTGRDQEHDYLRELGAAEIVGREELSRASNRPLESERWAGAVDSVGGATLAGILRALAINASVAACGNAGGPELNTTVLPFILRGANLLGIDSFHLPNARRRQIWARIARDLPLDKLDRTIKVIPLGELPGRADEILRGQVRGRTVVDVNV